MSPELDRIASGTIADGEPVGRRTGCASVRTSGSVGALAGNRQGHPAEWHLVFAKAVQEITFGVPSWFSEARFIPIRSVGHPMDGDSVKQLLVKAPAPGPGAPLLPGPQDDAPNRSTRAL